MIDLSMYTEKLTDVQFLEEELKNGISLDNPYFMDLAKNTIAQLNGYGNTILDYGAGVGAYSKAAIDAGYKVFTNEKFEAHKQYLVEKIPEINIVEKLPQTDILLLIEVAEHMTNDEIEYLFDQIMPKWILFSSTPHKTEWDNLWGHINVKSDLEWNDFFLKLHYREHKKVNLPTEWSKIYEKI